MVCLVCGVSLDLVVSHVVMVLIQGSVNVTILRHSMVVPSAREEPRRVKYAKRNHAQVSWIPATYVKTQL